MIEVDICESLADLNHLVATAEGGLVGRPASVRSARTFGGHILAQSFLASARTISSDLVPTSLHMQFLRPATASMPLVHEVTALRDGRSYSTRDLRVAHHDGPTLASAIVTWRSPDEEAFSLSAPHELPPVPGPQDLPYPAPGVLTDDLDLRWLDVAGGRGLWFRATRTLGADPRLHTAVALYVSDLWLLDTLLGAVGRRFDDRTLRAGSVEHSAWFHRDVVLDDWCYLESHAVSLAGGCGLVSATLHSSTGEHLASFNQTVSVRHRTDRVTGTSSTDRP